MKVHARIVCPYCGAGFGRFWRKRFTFFLELLIRELEP